MAELEAPDADGSGSTSRLRTLAEEVVLALPAIEEVLVGAARAASEGIGLSCGITYMSRYGAITVASSDALANAVDEMQYGATDGPCLEAMRTATVVRVDDLQVEERWPPYRHLAVAAGVRSSLSYPLIVDRLAIGALNVYSTAPGPWPADVEAATIVASEQATGALQAVRRFALNVITDPVTARGFQERADQDIVTGMLMVEHSCGEEEARAVLVRRAQAQGVSIRVLVARMIAGAGADGHHAP
jgi:GAF domain-containing protein